MTEKQRAVLAVEGLKQLYPDAVCSLNYKNPYELLIATRLSAQCTDARVNIVTPALFEKYPDCYALAKADLSDVEELIKTCGLYKSKAKSLVEIGKMLSEDFGGTVPDTIEELTKLPGVGRKTANLVCGDIYGKPAVVTDTHFIRICNRLGFVKTKDPLKVEMKMKKLLPKEESNDFCHRCVLFGRAVCTARKANCQVCPLSEICPKKV